MLENSKKSAIKHWGSWDFPCEETQQGMKLYEYRRSWLVEPTLKPPFKCSGDTIITIQIHM
jgi:hypothetical protein